MHRSSAVLLALALAALGAHVAEAQPAAKVKTPGKRYQICLWPNPCGPTLRPSLPPKSKKKAAPKEKSRRYKPGAPVYPYRGDGIGDPYFDPADPLSQTILRRSMTEDNDGVVSAIRLKPEHSGWKEEQILYRGGRDLSLPGSALRTGKPAGNAGSDKEWTKIDSGGMAAGQVNGMRRERLSLTRGAGESRAGADRMWGKAGVKRN